MANGEGRERYLKIALIAIGLFMIFGVFALAEIWPSGWSWHGSGQNNYLQMILAIYATLGVFLILASRDPAKHASLISFTIWSSIAHGGVMGVQAAMNPHHHMGHLYGDVPALFLVAGVLYVLRPRSV
jgi:hypothetical protein